MAWKVVKSDSSYGPKGEARLQINKSKGQVRIVMDGKAYIVDKDECPEVVQSWLKSGVPNTTFFVSLKADEAENVTGIFGIYPFNYPALVGKVKSFAAPEGEAPTPKTNEKWGYKYFTVLIEIESPKEFAGMIAPATFRYHFKPMEQEIKGKTYTVVGIGHPKSKYTPVLMEFLEIHKVTDTPMKFTDNLLPALQKRVLSADVAFQFSVKNGWFDNIWDVSGLGFNDDLPTPKAEEVDDSELSEDFDTTPTIEASDTAFAGEFVAEEWAEETPEVAEEDEIPWTEN